MHFNRNVKINLIIKKNIYFKNVIFNKSYISVYIYYTSVKSSWDILYIILFVFNLVVDRGERRFNSTQ